MEFSEEFIEKLGEILFDGEDDVRDTEKIR